jgi:VIT1/CCC1 family predicted Fe2+/Mn2+ transporter
MPQPPQGTPTPPSDDSKPNATKAQGDGGIGVAGMVVAAVGGGVGVLGFVAFFGAAILWARLDEAGLPGNEAVAVIPRSVLLSTGANFLVPSLLAALAFVALLYLIETATVNWGSRSLRELETKLEGREEVAKARQKEAAVATHRAAKAAEIASAMGEVAVQAAESDAIDARIAQEANLTAQAAAENATQLRQALPAAVAAEEEMKDTKLEVERERLAAREWIEGKQRALRRTLTFGAFLLGAVVTFVWFSIGIDPGRFFFLLLLIAALATVSLAILSRTDSFAWFALAVVFAVGLVSCFLTYYRTVDNTKVEPVALLRSNGAPVYGFFVAQTSDRVYLGTRMAGGAMRMAAIPRDEVTEIAIGSLAPVAEAERQARVLAVQICRLARQREPLKPCTGADMRRLVSY